MPDFDVVFEKLGEIARADDERAMDITLAPTSSELDEIEELRRFSAELQEPEPTSYTTTS
jgi:hypothetical protein